jgi:hypothetical protein
MKLETLCLHGGQAPDPTTGSRAVPVYRTASYVFKNTEHAANLFALKELGNIYTRLMNPTTDVLEKRVALLEGAHEMAGLGLASGTSAVFYSIINLAQAGDNIVSARNLYGGTYTQFNDILPALGITVKLVDSNDPENFRKAIDDKDYPHGEMFFTLKDDDNFYCYCCDKMITDMDFKCIATCSYEWERNIEYLVCGIHCTHIDDTVRGMCEDCGVVVDIGYYRDLPKRIKCAEHAVDEPLKTCCYYCGDAIDDIEAAKTILDETDNINNLVCSYACLGIPDEMKNTCDICGTLFFEDAGICGGCCTFEH